MLKLALQNIKEKKLRTFLSIFSIAIGTASMIIFLGISNGIKSATFEELQKQNPLTQITVRPDIKESSLLSLISSSKEGSLTKETIAEISKIDGVGIIHPEIQFNNFASLEANILGFGLITDTMIFGVPVEFIKNDLTSEIDWDTNQEPFPALIPRKILELYNMAIAYPQGLPTVSEENMIGKTLTLYPNYSTFFPGMNSKKDEIKLEIVGFSDKISLLGATLPLGTVEKLNQKYSNTNNDKYLELFVETVKASITSEVATQIETLGYSTQYFQKNIKEVEAKFTYLTISLGTISFIILLTTAIAIISTFLATITERTKEIGLLRALGATKKHIKQLILKEAGIIGIIGSVFGTTMGLIASIFINSAGLKQLEKTIFSPETLFKVTPTLIIVSIFFGTFLSIISAYLPAQKASEINPIKALKF